MASYGLLALAHQGGLASTRSSLEHHRVASDSPFLKTAQRLTEDLEFGIASPKERLPTDTGPTRLVQPDIQRQGVGRRRLGEKALIHNTNSPWLCQRNLLPAE